MPSRWTAPSAKVVAATVAAFLIPMAMAIIDDGAPIDFDGWATLVAKCVLMAFGVGGTSYVKFESRPAPSAKERLADRGEVVTRAELVEIIRAELAVLPR